MAQDKEPSWFKQRKSDFRELQADEPKLKRELSKVETRIREIEQELNFWEHYYAWNEQLAQSEEDRKLALGACKHFRAEVQKEHEKRTQEAERIRSRLGHIKTLQDFIKWAPMQREFFR